MRIRRLALSVSLFLLLPCVASATLTPFTFLSGFNGANERPPNASTNGSYMINTLQYDDAIGTFGQFSVNVTYNGLQGNANNSHIHGYIDSSTNAGVVQALSHTGDTMGTISGTWNLPSTTARDNLFNGLTYLNLHSTVFGGGEWRGQLVPVPEPSLLALSGLGCGLLLLRWRRRR
jgi:hypothetical protein